MLLRLCSIQHWMFRKNVFKWKKKLNSARNMFEMNNSVVEFGGNDWIFNDTANGWNAEFIEHTNDGYEMDDDGLITIFTTDHHQHYGVTFDQ